MVRVRTDSHVQKILFVVEYVVEHTESVEDALHYEIYRYDFSCD